MEIYIHATVHRNRFLFNLLNTNRFFTYRQV